MRRAMVGVLATVMVGTGLVVAQDARGEEIVLKMWARADRSGPLRAGNVVEAAAAVNAWLAAAKTGKTVKVEVFESPAPGFDADALEL